MGTMHGKLELEGGRALWVGNEGQRWLVGPSGGRVNAGSLLPETLVGAIRVDAHHWVFVGESGQTYLASEPLGPPRARHPPPVRFDRVFVQGRQILGLAGTQDVFRSADGGETWSRCRVPTSHRPIAALRINVRGEGLALLVAQGALLTMDHGQSWTPISLHDQDGRDLWTDPADRVCVLGRKGTVCLQPTPAGPRLESAQLRVPRFFGGHDRLGETAADSPRPVYRMIAGGRLVEFRSGGRSLDISVGRLGAPPEWRRLPLGCRTPKVGGYGTEVVLACEDNDGSTRLWQAGTRDSPWRSVGEVQTPVKEIVVGPRGWLYLRTPSPGSGPQAQLRPAGASTFGPGEPYDAFAFDEQAGKVFAFSATGIAGPGLHLGELGDRSLPTRSPWALTSGASMLALSYDTAAREGRAILSSGSSARLATFDANGAVTHEAELVPGPCQAASLAHRNGFALCGGRGWETSDGGRSWKPDLIPSGVSESPWMLSPVHCSAEGCVVGQQLRVGWGTMPADWSSPEAAPLRAKPQRADVECSRRGRSTRLFWPTSGDPRRWDLLPLGGIDVASDVLFAAAVLGPDQRAIAMVARAAGERVRQLPLLGRAAVAARTITKTYTQSAGVIATRVIFSAANAGNSPDEHGGGLLDPSEDSRSAIPDSHQPQPLQPVRAEVVWYSHQTQKVSRAAFTLPPYIVHPWNEASIEFDASEQWAKYPGVAAIDGDSLFFRPDNALRKDIPLYRIDPQGHPTPIAFPPVSARRLVASRVGRWLGLFSADPDDPSYETAWSEDGGTSWQRRTWSLWPGLDAGMDWSRYSMPWSAHTGYLMGWLGFSFHLTSAGGQPHGVVLGTRPAGLALFPLGPDAEPLRATILPPADALDPKTPVCPPERAGSRVEVTLPRPVRVGLDFPVDDSFRREIQDVRHATVWVEGDHPACLATITAADGDSVLIIPRATPEGSLLIVRDEETRESAQILPLRCRFGH